MKVNVTILFLTCLFLIFILYLYQHHTLDGFETLNKNLVLQEPQVYRSSSLYQFCRNKYNTLSTSRQGYYLVSVTTFLGVTTTNPLKKRLPDKSSLFPVLWHLFLPTNASTDFSTESPRPFSRRLRPHLVDPVYQQTVWCDQMTTVSVHVSLD